MPIVVVAPIVIPAVAEVIYDRWWLQDLHVEAPHPDQPVALSARFVAYRLVPSGVELDPAGPRQFKVEDLFALAQSSEDSQYRDVIDLVANAVAKVGVTTGNLPGPPVL